MARDPMFITVGPLWHCYYSAHPDGQHGVWVRTSTDLMDFSESRLVMTGGQAGDEWYNLECPHVVHFGGWFYLLHTHNCALGRQQSSVYRSVDPAYSGIDDDSNFVCHLPIAAPEFIQHVGKYCLPALAPNLVGIRIADPE